MLLKTITARYPPEMGPRGSSPTIRELQVFQAVIEGEGFAEAAARLGSSTSRMWHSVDSLEKKLGLPRGLLLHVTAGRAVAPTPAGRYLLSSVEEVLSALEGLAARASALKHGSAAQIRISCYPAHVQGFVARALGTFAARWPNIELVMVGLSDESRAHSGASVLTDLAAGSVDLAIARRGSASTSIFRETPLYEWELVAGATEKRADSLQARQLEGRPLLLSPPGYHSRELVERTCREAGFHPRVFTDSTSTDVLVALAQAGFGIPILPSDAIRPTDGLHWTVVKDSAGDPITGVYSVYRRRPDESGELALCATGQDPVEDLAQLIGAAATDSEGLWKPLG